MNAPTLAPLVSIHEGYEKRLQRGPLRSNEVEPLTIRAVLMCEQRCDAPTAHKFVGRRRLFAPKNIKLTYDECIYACRRCGEERVWGTEDVGSLSK